MNRDVVIVSAARTAVGSFLGAFADLKAQTLGAYAMREAIKRANIDGSLIDEIIVGNIIQTEPKGNPAREAMLEAGLPIQIPAFTVNKNCASSLKAVSLAALMIKVGEADVILVAGMENMSRTPYVIRNARKGFRMGDQPCEDLLLELLEGMGLTAERLADKYRITREAQDQFAFESHMKAAKAQAAGLFNDEIVPVEVPGRKGTSITVNKDEGVRLDITLETLSKLKPVFKKDGTVTAGNSSSINDGAGALILMAAEKANELGLKPLVRIKGWASAGCDPDIMGIGPVPSTRRLMNLTGMGIHDFDLIELNEAFASQSLAVVKELKFDLKKVNVNGGAISLGHPTGATGSILLTKLIYEMKRRQSGTGLATMCIGGGQGMSIVLENL